MNDTPSCSVCAPIDPERQSTHQDWAAHVGHALCRSRVVEEMRRYKGTVTADQLKLVLGISDKPTPLPSNDRYR
jgi:hypothetical protein